MTRPQMGTVDGGLACPSSDYTPHDKEASNEP
jgi:hypothetical protein